MTTHILSISDTHIGSKLAICPRVVELDSGGTYHASPGQRWLLDNFYNMIDNLPTTGEKIVIHGGDLIELDAKKRNHEELITSNKADALKMTTAVFTPAIQWADKWYQLRGTEAHVGAGAWAEETFAADLDNVIPKRKPTTTTDENGVEKSEKNGEYSWYHLTGRVEGINLDAAHHASMGRTLQARLNAGNAMYQRALLEYGNRGVTAPDLVLRAHNHTFSRSAEGAAITVLFNGAWTFKGAYAYRVGLEMILSDIGAWLITVDDKHMEVKKFQYKVEDKPWRMRL